MTIRPLQPHEHERWIELRHALWPACSMEQIRAEAAAYGSVLREAVLVADRGDGTIVAFVEVSIRPYGRGCPASPIGYVEGWYVEPAERRKGVGRALVDAAEAWARGNGCAAMGSDRDWDNDVSRSAHLSLGYRPTEPCEVFWKPLAADAPEATEYIGLVPWELDTGTLVERVSAGAAGGIAVFLG